MNNPGPKAIIHLDRLGQNIQNIKKHLGGLPLACVVKANAYGHGAVPIAKKLESFGIQFFCGILF